MNTIQRIQQKYKTKLKGSQLILKACPYCENTNWNLEINIEKKVWHCWICDNSGALMRFCNDNKIAYEEQEYQLPDRGEVKKVNDPLELILTKFSTPIAFKDIEKLCLNKGIDEQDIGKYNFRKSNYKKYRDKLLIPLYEGNRLAYLIFRDLVIGGKYYNIEENKTSILPYYLGRINKFYLYLCEGVFDAISINKLGYSSGVLLGTSISDTQINKIKKFGFDNCVVCLDGDAQYRGVGLCEKLNYYNIKTKMVFFGRDEDPNDVYVKDKDKLLYQLQKATKINLLSKIKL